MISTKELLRDWREQDIEPSRLAVLLIGDARERLTDLPDGSVQTCITSPPYFGLRDYGAEGQIGLEPTPEEFVAALVAVFREVRRVLRDDGTLWLNLGDSYNAYNGNRGNSLSISGARDDQRPRRPPGAGMTVPTLKQKDLIGIPWMVAFALRADGWYLRSDIIWHKPNPMPESVTDRPTRSHEFVFLLTKRPRYYYDTHAIREEGVEHRGRAGTFARSGAVSSHVLPRQSAAEHRSDRTDRVAAGRNKRDVWTVASRPFAGAHFATFPVALVEPMVLAGSPPHCCAECGAPFERHLEAGGLDESRPQARRALELANEAGLTVEHIDAIRSTGITDTGRGAATQSGTGKNTPEVQQLAEEAKEALGGYWREFLLARRVTTGWVQSCEHDAGDDRALVLDPFAGSATTGVAALKHGRAFVGVELNPEYAALARERLVREGSIPAPTPLF